MVVRGSAKATMGIPEQTSRPYDSFRFPHGRSKWRDLQRVWAARLQLTEEIRNAKGFSRILVNSLFSRESVVRAYGMESDVCYLGVDSDRFPAVNGRREPQMISVGFLYFGKGADRALKAIASIPKLQRPRLSGSVTE